MLCSMYAVLVALLVEARGGTSRQNLGRVSGAEAEFRTG